MYFVHLLSSLVDDFAALLCAHFVSLPKFGFEIKIQNSGFNICDSESAKVRLWPSLRRGRVHGVSGEVCWGCRGR